MALLAIAAAPASAQAAEWKTLPETVSSADPVMLAAASVAPGGGSSSLLWTQGAATRSAERPVLGSFEAPKELTGTAWGQARNAQLDDGTTLVAYQTGTNTFVAQRTRNGEFATPAQDLGPSAFLAGLELVALPDGSALAAFLSADSTAIKVFRRAAGATTFTAVTLPAVTTSSIRGFVLRGAPDGSAVLAFTNAVVSPGPQTTQRLHVSVLDQGDSRFEVPEAIGEPAVSGTPDFLLSWKLIPTDAIVGDDGSIDVAATRVSTGTFMGTTTELLTLRRSPAGTWDPPEILDSAASMMPGMPGSTDLSALDLVAGAGGAATAAWGTRMNGMPATPPSHSVKISRRGPGANDFAPAQTVLSGPAGELGFGTPQVVAMPGGSALLAAARGAGITVLDFSPAGTVVDQDDLATAGGPVSSLRFDAASGSAILAVAKQVDTTHRVQAYAIDQEAKAPQTPAPPVVGGGAQQTADITAPAITGLKLSRKRFATRGKKRGTQLRFSVSEAGRVAVAVERSVRGWKTGKRCTTSKPKRKAAKKAKRCTTVRVLGTFTRATKQGANTLSFTGKLGKKTLGRGTYRFRIIATDAAGNRSRPARATFTITRR
jgi:hypothetical protein